MEKEREDLKKLAERVAGIMAEEPDTVIRMLALAVTDLSGQIAEHDTRSVGEIVGDAFVAAANMVGELTGANDKASFADDEKKRQFMHIMGMGLAIRLRGVIGQPMEFPREETNPE